MSDNEAREALAKVIEDAAPISHDFGYKEIGRMTDAVIAHLALSAQEAATEVGSRDAGLIQAEKVLRGIENHWPADSVAAAIHELRALRETVAESEEAATEVEATRAIELAMLEYSQAIRGDWSDFDGRSERDIIEGWVEELRNPNSEHTLEWWRNRLGICPDGNGHWAGFSWGHCREDDCPISYAQDQEGKTDE